MEQRNQMDQTVCLRRRERRPPATIKSALSEIAPSRSSDCIEVWYDGCCEPVNPGGNAACGIVIKRGGQVLWQESRYIGSGPAMSNNVAEYGGMIAALEYLIEKGLTHFPVVLHGDSMLSVRQMTGEWRIKGGRYLPYYLKAKELARQFSDITFLWIPREENAEADTLSKAVLKEQGIRFRIQKEENGVGGRRP
ncbi:ribonuclease HI family protein [Candidatus Manganitrophus noduliformans]|uniref:Ribonuclease HI family protein n=1 Tax=Candidatus Manganitrophus noduliformans TaxID=2606439 RepID=A0A7X6DTP6_9BACT|nr:ribonuclease HI family protein [Candidatus Manganitrophus noduliformans]NKE72858.1 ribonuclease HI family protein [Candidatus Manganitrophus noduliformans]